MRSIDSLVSEVKRNLESQSAPVNAPAVGTKKVADKVSPKKMTLDIAKKLAKAVEIAADIIGVKVVVSVRDEGANLILLHAMDDSYIASVQASQDKAYTAVALKMPTHKALEESRGGALDGLTNGNGILLLGGGYPLGEDKIYGGIGVSGGTKEQDIVLAKVAALYFNTL